MADRRDTFIVSTEWLNAHLDAPDVVILDGSWHLPPTGRKARAEYGEAHIPGAMFFDIDDICDESSDLPHMLPRPEKFSSRMRKLGIGDGQKIVVYDQTGLFSAPRVWWMFRVMGHEDVVVLDGGLPKWMAENRPVTQELPMPRDRHFTARRNAAMVADADDVAMHLSTGTAQVVDARPADRFAGRAPEPRPGVRSGHIAGACNLPFPALLNGGGTLKGNDDILAAFRDAGVDPDRPIVTMCGSGVTAAILSLALDVVGRKPAGLYDGSWAEWGLDGGREVATD
ncbi:MAG: 3-mercaptopyruvate sulfurtransferase [Rhodobiaceae bacterium]|nr:3-mercaptopyruvate sulfurtransferase [Rhodobiaceae bacterium]